VDHAPSRLTDDDAFWLRRALAEAERGRGGVEPNPMVGAAVVREGGLVGVGHHARHGGPHAEVVALEQAGAAARGATLHVSLEPCCHQGKTPPCTDAIIRAGVARVVAAMPDPFPKVAGGGFAKLREAGLGVELGPPDVALEACRLNAPYLKRLATGRPLVTAKWAMTLDGRIATSTGDSRWISGERSRALVHEMRGRMDAIVVGIGTVLSDDPGLTARPPGPRVAARVVLDSQARLPTTSQLVRTAGDVPVLVAVTELAPAERCSALAALGCQIMPFHQAEGLVPVSDLLDELGRRGATNVLVEGGSRILGAFLQAGEIDEVEVYVAPVIEGGAHSVPPVSGVGVTTMAEALRLSRHSISTVDGDLLVRGSLSEARWRTLEGLEP